MPTLDWLGKKAVVNHHRHVPFHLLKSRDDLSCGVSNSGNILVQADNLLALKALLPYYAGQVKCIYIDPPYNTGNEGWVYNDNVNSPEMKTWLGKAVGREAEDLSRHDKWLCMMYPRLQLLREFLREDGAIFISIDENENSNLRLLMNEIFGEENFITTIIWEKNYAPKASAKHLSENHEYVIVFAKSKNKWHRNLLPRTEKQDKAYKNMDNDPRGLWRPNNLAARNPYSLGIYSITCPSGRVVNGPPKGSYWRVSKEKFDELDRDGRIWWGKAGNNVPAPKIFLSEVKQGVVPMTIWPYLEAGHTQDAKKELIEILPSADQVFSTPKPVKLISRIIQLATNPGDLILDSFAGSGTTGHAVLSANHTQKDLPPRHFILVEMDSKICNEITAQRLTKVISGHDTEKGFSVGFSYCELGLPLFDEKGRIKSEVTFKDLARHVFFSETGKPLPDKAEKKFPLLGVSDGIAVYLLYNGVLKDKNPSGGNVLTVPVLQSLSAHDGPKVIYGVGCRIGAVRLTQENVTFRQIPYEIKVS